MDAPYTGPHFCQNRGCNFLTREEFEVFRDFLHSEFVELSIDFDARTLHAEMMSHARNPQEMREFMFGVVRMLDTYIVHVYRGVLPCPRASLAEFRREAEVWAAEIVEVYLDVCRRAPAPVER